MPSLRKELGKVLVELGKEHKNLVVITGDLGKSTGVSAFEAFPERYFNLGIRISPPVSEVPLWLLYH